MERMISLLTITIILAFYSFIFYTISFAPFLGLEVTNFFSSLLFISIASALILLGIFIYYHFYDKYAFLQNKIFHLVFSFSFSFSSIFIVDYFFDFISIALWMKFMISLFLMFNFKEDPNSFRSLKRLANKKNLFNKK